MNGRRTVYHDHMVEMARRRLGRRKADELLVDAARGHRTHGVALGKAMDGQVRHRQQDGFDVRYISSRTSPLWRGAELQLENTLPEAVQTAMVGMRLGDVVANSGADDHVILGSSQRAEGTRIFVKTNFVRADEIRLPAWSRLTGPVRRGLRIAIKGWLDEWYHNERRGIPAGIHDLLPAVTFLLILTSLTAIMVAAGIHMGLWGLAVLAIVLPAMLYITSGVATAMVIDYREMRRERLRQYEA